MDLDIGWEEDGWRRAVSVKVRGGDRATSGGKTEGYFRNLVSREEEGARIESSGDLAVRIVGGRYKMLYAAGTEETLRRVTGAAEAAQLEHKARQRRDERQASRWFQ